MNDLIMTVNGWAATDPSQHVGPTGARLTSFRMASTSRYYDRENVGDKRYSNLRYWVQAEARILAATRRFAHRARRQTKDPSTTPLPGT